MIDDGMGSRPLEPKYVFIAFIVLIVVFLLLLQIYYLGK